MKRFCALLGGAWVAVAWAQDAGSASRSAQRSLSTTSLSTPVYALDAMAVWAPFSPLRQWLPRDTPDSEPVLKSSLQTTPLSAFRYVGYLQAADRRVALMTIGQEVWPVRLEQQVGVEGARLKRIDEGAVYFALPAPNSQQSEWLLPPLRMYKEAE